MFVTHAQTQRYSLFLAYRIFSIKRRGVNFIFSVSDAAFIQERRLFEGGVCFDITFLKSLTTVTVNRFLNIMYLKGSNLPLILLR